MKLGVLVLIGLMAGASPALAQYDTRIDNTSVDSSDLDRQGLDTQLSDEGLSQGNDFSDRDTQVDSSDMDRQQDTNDLDIPPTPEPAYVKMPPPDGGPLAIEE